MYDSLGNATSLTDVTGTVSYVYNEVGRVLKAILPNGRIIYYYYTNDKLSKVTMDGYEIVYSSSGKVLSFSINGVPVQQSNYTDIDSKELLQSVVYANGVTRSYEYNSDGSVSRITLGSGSVKYEYDSEGNLTEVLDEENLIKYIFRTETTSTEDEGAEENKRNYVDVCVENDEDWIVLYSYEVDEDGALLQFGTSLFSYTDNNAYLQSGTVKYRQQTINNYNGNVYLRNVSKKALDTGVESTLYSQEFTYFSNGLVKSEKITLANGTEMLYNYIYDEEQRLSSVSLNGVIQSTFEYDVNGWLKDDKNFANGVHYVYSYNTDGNLKARYVYYLQTDGSWKLVGAHPHKYDTTYRDEVLTGYNETYTYDEAGNPLTYFKQSTMTWNGNDLASYSNGTTTATYSYVDGLRTKKVVNGVTYLYSWQDDRLVSQVKLNENGQIAEKLVFWYDESNNLIGFVYNDTDVYTYVRNQLGDIVYILDNNGQIVVTYQYLATGRVYSITDTTSNKIGTINPFRYRGYYYDNESKMYYLKARYYCPDLMRFLSPDAPEYLDVDVANSKLPLNLYAYCENDPVQNTDYDGHCYYNSELNWCHDNWEYRYNYKRKKAPPLSKYLFSARFSVHLKNGGVMTFPKNYGLIRSYGTTRLYTKKVEFLSYKQLKDLVKLMEKDFLVSMIKDAIMSKAKDKIKKLIVKTLVKHGLSSLAKSVSVVMWVKEAIDIFGKGMKALILKSYRSYVKKCHGLYMYTILSNDRRIVPTCTYCEWMSEYTVNPTKSGFYIKK